MAALGVFGGTFDPPHTGHLILAEQARVQLGLRRVLWVPSGDPWRKAQRTVTAAEHRCAMVHAAIAGNRAFELSTLEVDRAGPSYSVDTLAALQSQFPEQELIFIVGLDALRDLPKWHKPRRVIELATLAVAQRGRGRLTARELDALLPGLRQRVVWLEMPRIDISATDLRARAAAGGSLRYFVPPAVESYRRRQHLYDRR